jgi:transposase
MVKTAAPLPQLIPKSMSSPSLLAHIAVAKYHDHLPLYRQEQIFSTPWYCFGPGHAVFLDAHGGRDA